MNIENVSTVQEIYAAFGRGDVEAVVRRVQPNVDWGFAAPQPGVPWHQPVQGASQVARFFGTLAEAVSMTHFEPREFVHCGPHLMVDVRIEYTVKATGKKVAMDQIHWWTLEGGKVQRLRHYEDTAQVVTATSANG